MYASGIGLTDTELRRLVKYGMEREIGRKPEANVGLSHSCTAPTSMVWHLSGRPGRPPKTFVGIELFEGSTQTRAAYTLMSAPDDPLVKSELIRSISRLTYRVLFAAAIDSSTPPRRQRPSSNWNDVRSAHERKAASTIRRSEGNCIG